MILTNKNDNIITLSKKKIMLLAIIKQYSARSADTPLVLKKWEANLVLAMTMWSTEGYWE